MKTLYLDIFSGISGDMFIGAMLDLGVEFELLESELMKLGLDGYQLRMGRQERSSISGVKFDVELEGGNGNGEGHSHSHEHGDTGHSHGSDEHDHDHDHAHSHSHDHSHEDTHDHSHSHAHAHSHSHGSDEDGAHSHEGSRNYQQIKALIRNSALSDWVKEKAIAVFHRVAVAEGKVHGMPPEEVHFHEVGAVDSIIDIVGACVALEALGKPEVLAAPVVEGRGWVDCAHGRFPVPSTATLEILSARGIPIDQCDEPHELVTPTGAALLAEFARSFGPMTGLRPRKIGYGLGTRENRTRPNVLRAILADASSASSEADWETDTVTVLETNLDDMSPELLGYFMEKAFAEGALDVFYIPMVMKKHRPGILLSVICANEDADKLSQLAFRETTAFGIRRTRCDRRKLPRTFIEVETAWGKVSVKQGRLKGEIAQVAPEFESCRAVAEANGVALKTVYEEALRLAREKMTKEK